MLTPPLRRSSINFVITSSQFIFIMTCADRCSACAKPVHRSPRAQKCWGNLDNFVTQNLLRTRTVMNWFRTGLAIGWNFYEEDFLLANMYTSRAMVGCKIMALTNQPNDCCLQKRAFVNSEMRISGAAARIFMCRIRFKAL